MQSRHLLSINDLSRSDVQSLFATAQELKGLQKKGIPHGRLEGRSLAMIFEKPSLRTRATFEIGMFQLGGKAVYFQPHDIKLGVRETVADVAHNLERWFDLIMCRVFTNKTARTLAENSRIPVINGLCDREHPCQALTDLFTVQEHMGTLAGRTLAFIGDGNNVAHSLMLLCAKVGMDFNLACPAGYEPDPGIVMEAESIAAATGAQISVSNDPIEMAKGADILYADVWVSMGQENETQDRLKIFQPFQINKKLLDQAHPNARVMHCLPAHRGEEITDEVIDGPQSIVFDQAENRLHVQKAIMVSLLDACP
jgi:ornithine carbamoyltransferase